MIEEQGKILVESNELIKNDFNFDRDGVVRKKEKEIFNKLLAKGASDFVGINFKINHNKLISNF